jgi:hypothetical protein
MINSWVIRILWYRGIASKVAEMHESCQALSSRCQPLLKQPVHPEWRKNAELVVDGLYVLPFQREYCIYPTRSSGPEQSWVQCASHEEHMQERALAGYQYPGSDHRTSPDMRSGLRDTRGPHFGHHHGLDHTVRSGEITLDTIRSSACRAAFTAPSSLPLVGIRVLGCTRVAAGALMATYPGDHGAEVSRLEEAEIVY